VIINKCVAFAAQSPLILYILYNGREREGKKAKKRGIFKDEE
jgi:hypothetical protein